VLRHAVDGANRSCSPAPGTRVDRHADRRGIRGHLVIVEVKRLGARRHPHVAGTVNAAPARPLPGRQALGGQEVYALGIVAGRRRGPPPGENGIIAVLRVGGLAPHAWGTAPGDTCGWHEHGYEKVLYCTGGRIVFHAGSGDADLGPADRSALPPHTPHAATAGAEGVRCVEAARQG
jgi:AraC-like ligand binding domain